MLFRGKPPPDFIPARSFPVRLPLFATVGKPIRGEFSLRFPYVDLGHYRRAVHPEVSIKTVPQQQNLTIMLHYAIVFLVVAIIAAVLGFGGIAGTAAWIAKVLFIVFLILAIISFLTGRRPGV